MHPCTEFGVASSKFAFTGGPHVKTASSPLARAAGTPQERHPQWILSWYSTRVTCEFGFRGCPPFDPQGLFEKIFGSSLRGGTCHVPRTGDRPATGTIVVPAFPSASIGATPVPIGPAVRALFPEMLGHTDRQTDRLTNTSRLTFFRRPTGGNLRS